MNDRRSEFGILVISRVVFGDEQPSVALLEQATESGALGT